MIPGPFAFASEARVNRVLAEAGFTVSRWSLVIWRSIPRSGGALRLRSKRALEIGPASRALDGHPADVSAAATNSVREALAAFAKGQTVPLPASIWIVTAASS